MGTQAQLRATLEVSQQQVTQVEKQLEELQQQSSQIQVPGTPALPHCVLRLCPVGSPQALPGTLGRRCELP